MIDVKKLTQEKIQLTDLWAFLQLPQPMPDVSFWLIKYGFEMIESALQTLKKVLNKGRKIDSVEKYLGKMLATAWEHQLTPEQWDSQISEVRATAGRIRAAKAQKQKLAEARAELVGVMENQKEEVLPEAAKPLLSFAGGLLKDAEVCSNLLDDLGLRFKGLGFTVEDLRQSKPASQATDRRNSKSSNLKPITRKPKTCRDCGEILQRDKNHSCQQAVTRSRPPSRDGVLCGGCMEMLERCICPEVVKAAGA
jgi:hypothetical protein